MGIPHVESPIVSKIFGMGNPRPRKIPRRCGENIFPECGFRGKGGELGLGTGNMPSHIPRLVTIPISRRTWVITAVTHNWLRRLLQSVISGERGWTTPSSFGMILMTKLESNSTTRFLRFLIFAKQSPSRSSYNFAVKLFVSPILVAKPSIHFPVLSRMTVWGLLHWLSLCPIQVKLPHCTN